MHLKPQSYNEMVSYILSSIDKSDSVNFKASLQRVSAIPSETNPPFYVTIHPPIHLSKILVYPNFRFFYALLPLEKKNS